MCADGRVYMSTVVVWPVRISSGRYMCMEQRRKRNCSSGIKRGSMLKKLWGSKKESEFVPVDRVPYQPLTCYGKILDITRGCPLRIVMMSDILSGQNSLSSFDSRSSFVECAPGAITGVVRPANFPNGNILILAGNLTKTGDIAELEQFNKFLLELCSLSKYDHIVLIAGEHDRTLDPAWIPSRGQKPDCALCLSALLNNLPPTVHYLQDSTITIYGLRIYGTPWVAGDGHDRWGFNLPESDLRLKWQAIPRDTDILVSRMSPHEIGDMHHDACQDSIVDGEQMMAWERRGSRSLLKRVKKVNPLLHVFGRECAGYGGYVWSPKVQRKSRKHLRTCFVNASICDEDFMPCHAPLVIDIDMPSARGYMELIGNESVSEYDKRAMDLYIATLLALEGFRLDVQEKEVLSMCLQLATTSEAVDTSLRAHHEMLVLHILDKYRVINCLFDCRKLSRGANEDSAADFARAQLVIPGMYIGGHHVAESKDTLLALGITHVCSCYMLEPAFPMDFNYHVIDIEDEVGADITAHFYSCSKFIEGALRARGTVYVHCQLGMSRSATICMAYLMQTKNATYGQAHAMVKRARPFICPNDSFVHQLKDLEDVGSIGC